MNLEKFINQSKPFLNYIVNWQNDLTALSIDEIVKEQPNNIAVLSVDIINGFCYEGPLSSPRVANLVQPITTLFKKSHAAGIKNFILTQDTHAPDSIEFESYPPHCIRDTSESDTVAAFKALDFWPLFTVIPKESLNSAIGTTLDTWLDEHLQVNTFIVVGDCTDLCTYQLAMHLKLKANAANKKARVILPANCVDTYDLPVDVAAEIGAIPHDGDFMHTVFLYSMMLNGIEVVAEIL